MISAVIVVWNEVVLTVCTQKKDIEKTKNLAKKRTILDKGEYLVIIPRKRRGGGRDEE